MHYTPLTPQQTFAYSLVMDTRQGLWPAAYFVQQTFSQTQCLRAHQALPEQIFSGCKVLLVKIRVLMHFSLPDNIKH